MCGILSLEWSHAQPTGRKTMDKSCQVYGNFHTGNHGMKCGTPGLYRSSKWGLRMVANIGSEMLRHDGLE